MTQGQTASEGLTASSNVMGVSHSAVRNILSVDSTHIGISEQCIAIEGVSEDPASFVQSDTIEEVVASEILSHYVRPAAHKVAGDVVLEETPLELGGSYPYQTTSVVIEETLVNSSSEGSSGGITVAQPHVSDGLSIVTVVTRRVSKAFWHCFSCDRFTVQSSELCQ